MTNLSTEENTLINRAFDCADQNDIEGFFLCCDEGFDVNKRLSIKPKKPPLYSVMDLVDIEVTVASLALRRINNIGKNDPCWTFLKALIERFGAENLIMADVSTPRPPDWFKNVVLNKFNPNWLDLDHSTFESSDAHFCLWNISRLDSKIPLLETDRLCVYAHNLPKELLKSFDMLEPLKALNSFFENCKVLEQKNKLNSSVGDIKDQKPVKQKSSLM